MSTTTLMMITLTGVSGIRIWRIPGMGNGGDCGVTVTTTMTKRRADRIPPLRRRRQPARRELAERLCSAGRDWQRAEEGEGDVNNDGNN